ncbi:MAG: enoyl-CoA hydratase-related protein [Acetobacteraceae bacterium]
MTYDLRDRVAWIGLDRPDKRNAVSDALFAALAAAIVRAHGEARAIVLHGHGPAFCAGLDLAEHRARDPAAVFHHSRSWHRGLAALRQGPIPAVAARDAALIDLLRRKRAAGLGESGAGAPRPAAL